MAAPSGGCSGWASARSCRSHPPSFRFSSCLMLSGVAFSFEKPRAGFAYKCRPEGFEAVGRRTAALKLMTGSSMDCLNLARKGRPPENLHSMHDTPRPGAPHVQTTHLNMASACPAPSCPAGATVFKAAKLAAQCCLAAGGRSNCVRDSISMIAWQET